MDEYCAFSKDHKCLKWEDYELTRHELEEADALCHSNWIEIQQLELSRNVQSENTQNLR